MTGGTIWERLEGHFRQLEAAASREDVDLEALQKRLEARARALRDAPPSGPVRLRFDALYFRTGADLYAVRLDQVHAVHTLNNFTAVPGAPAYVRGVAHLRGEILTLIDVADVMKIERKGLSDMRRAIVAGAVGRRLALLCGDVEDIYSVYEDELKPPPRRSSAGAAVEGIIGADRLLVSATEIINQVDPGGH